MTGPRDKHRSFRRLLHIGDDVWRYKVGSGDVFILSPAGKISIVRIHVLQHCDWYGYERDREKGNWTGVRPREVRAWIEANEVKA
jgi:hypothetical protein